MLVTDHKGSSREYMKVVMNVGFWTNTQTGTKEDHHNTNGVEVKCAKCKTKQYITPGMAWKCVNCEQEHK